jgi:2-iminobutanoate/2-iminopropanoate deaminase
MVTQIHSGGVYEGIAPYSQGIIHQDMVDFAGQTPDDANGETVGNDIERQTKQAISNIETLLSEANSSLKNIVSVTAYLTDMDDLSGFNRVYSDILPDPKPARATVEVSTLPSSEARVEIQVTAVRE